jgi:hypothetical protein
LGTSICPLLASISKYLELSCRSTPFFVEEETEAPPTNPFAEFAKEAETASFGMAGREAKRPPEFTAVSILYAEAGNEFLLNILRRFFLALHILA